jgi:hypothetical protein
MNSRPDTLTRDTLTPTRIVKATLVVLLFFFPILCVFAFLFLVSDFIPSLRLKPFSDIAAAIVAVVCALTISGLLYRNPKTPRPGGEHHGIVGKVGVILFAPYMGWVVAHHFISGPLAYRLHKTQVATAVTLDADVLGFSTRRERGCRRIALLSDARLVWDQKVCIRDEETARRLHPGGKLRVFGKTTDYGTEVIRYEVIRYASPDSYLNYPRPTDSTRRLSDFLPQQNK